MANNKDKAGESLTPAVLPKDFPSLPEERQGKILRTLLESLDKVPKERQEEILRTLLESLDEVPKERKPKILRTLLVQRVEQYSGPIPHPEDFGRYEEILPGAADRILTLTERNYQDVQRNESAQIRNEKSKINGSILVNVLMLCIAGIGAYQDNVIIALPFGLMGSLNFFLRQILQFFFESRSKED